MSVSTAVAAKRRTRRFFAEPGRAIGLQLYMLGDEATADLDSAFTRLAGLGYRDLELPNLMGKSAAELRAAADRAGVRFSSIHLGPAVLTGREALNFDSSPQRIADECGLLVITDAIMPLALLPDDFAPHSGEAFPAALARGFQQNGVDGWKRTAEALNRKAAALAAHGITLGYHNHNVEFAPLGRTSGWEVLMAETDASLVMLEIDLGWVAAAGLDPADFLRRHRARARWVHVKDLKASTRTNYALGIDPAEVGGGKLDWPAILRAAAEAGVRHYYVEQEPPYATSRFEAAARSMAFLSGVRA